MDRLKAMQTFVRIVEANSFSRAAETLGLPRASLTATLQHLEAFLGTPLLLRTTRRLSLTPDGAAYFEQCTRILADIEAAENGLRNQQARAPQGKLRLDLPGAVGRRIVLPQMHAFCAAYPALELVVSLSDRLVDLTQDGIDCALRVGALADSALVARQIGSMRFVTCAAPSYLARHGVPRTLDDLAEAGGHRAVLHFSGRTGRPFDWDFLVDGAVVKLPMRGALTINDADANVCCGLQGLGLIQAATYQVREHLDSGALVQVLPQWLPAPMPVSLLYPHSRMAAPKVRAFIDWATALFGAQADLAPMA